MHKGEARVRILPMSRRVRLSGPLGPERGFRGLHSMSKPALRGCECITRKGEAKDRILHVIRPVRLRGASRAREGFEDSHNMPRNAK